MPVRKSWDVLSKVNRHDRDTHISFEEKSHKYTIDGERDGWRSVTEVLSKFHDEFDPIKSATAVMNSRAYKNGTHNLSGKTQEQIIDYWGNENKKGTALHARMERSMNQRIHLKLRSSRHSSGELILDKKEAKFLDDDHISMKTHIVLIANRNNEVYTYDGDDDFSDMYGVFLGYYWEDSTVRRNPKEDAELGEDEPILNYKEALLETDQVEYFWNTHKYLEPFRSEWVVYDKDIKIAGTIDAVFKDTRDDTYWILDWKRVRTGLEADLEATRYGYVQSPDEWLEPVKPWATKMPEPLQDLYNTKYWNYSLQLNLYKMILEKNYGIKIKGMKLVQFHPEIGDECRTHSVVTLTDHVQKVVRDTT